MNVDVPATRVDASGVTHVAREWDTGYAAMALDSQGFTRMDESCRHMCARRGGGTGVVGAVDGQIIPVLHWKYPTATQADLLKLSTAISVSGAAIGSEMGTYNSNWKLVTSVAQSGMTMGRWVLQLARCGPHVADVVLRLMQMGGSHGCTSHLETWVVVVAVVRPIWLGA